MRTENGIATPGCPIPKPGLLLELGKTGMPLERAVLFFMWGFCFAFYIFIIYLVCVYVFGSGHVAIL